MNAATTHVYKTVGSCDIRADVFGAEPKQPGGRPAVVWIHGGGFIFGHRKTPRPHLLAALLQGGAVLVSIDHRLAPQTPLPDLMQDVLDAWTWVHDQGPALLGVDPKRMGLAGTSSGGFLALMGGLRAGPRPRVVASFWGFGDMTGTWETEPSAHYLKHPVRVSREQAWAGVGTQTVSEEDTSNDRSAFYLYCRQQGCLPLEVSGHDPALEPAWFDDWCPPRRLDAHYPPTLLVHGSDDSDVPCDESRSMAAALAAQGVEHQLVVVPGAGHGLSGIAATRVAEIEDAAANFMLAHLQ